MHVAIIADEERLRNEHGLLNRMCVGLMDEGAQVTRLVPEHVDIESMEERAVAIAQRVRYPQRIVPWLQRKRLERINEQFERRPPDVFFASGRGTWALALQLAQAWSVPLAFDIWSTRILPRIPRNMARTRVTAIAASRGVGRVAKRRFPNDAVAVVPYGVPIPREATEVMRSPEMGMNLAILGHAENLVAYQSLIRAIADFSRDRPEIRFILELEGPREHGVWKLLKRAELLDRVSTITRAQAHRHLLAQCDGVMLPEAAHSVRTLVLEMMAAGLPVFAALSPALDVLEHEKTAMIAQLRRGPNWSDVLNETIVAPAKIRRIGASGRSAIETHHRVSHHATELYRVLERCMTGGSIPFRKIESTGS